MLMCRLIGVVGLGGFDWLIDRLDVWWLVFGSLARSTLWGRRIPGKNYLSESLAWQLLLLFLWQSVSLSSPRDSSCHNVSDKLSLRNPCVTIPVTVSAKNCARQVLPQFLRTPVAQTPCVTTPAAISTKKLSLRASCVTIPATISANNFFSKIPARQYPSQFYRKIVS